MELSPEIKKQLSEQKKQCIFCKIISKETPGKMVYEDSKTEALLDIYPILKGHTIFMPKEHYPILPYLPDDDFKALMSTIPGLVKAVKSAMITTALNIFIANGGVAGQQAPHFLIHLLPRDPGDGFFNFFWKMKKNALAEDKTKILTQNFPAIMQNYFQKNGLSWHKGEGEIPNHLKNAVENSTILYQDEKVLVILPTNNTVAGQMEIYSKTEEMWLEKLSSEDSVHLFSVASFAASLAFQGLEAQGTNIVVKSGKTDDHPSGRLCVYILPRKDGDALGSMIWKPEQPKYDLDSVMGKIKDKTWKITEEKKKEIVKKPEVKIAEVKKEVGGDNRLDEIKEAIEKMHKI